MISVLCYEECNVSQLKNLNFPDYMFSLWFLHATGDNIEKQKEHKMNELSIPRELMKLVLKKVYHLRVILPSIMCVLHWFLWKPKTFDSFETKPHLNNSAVVL